MDPISFYKLIPSGNPTLILYGPFSSKMNFSDLSSRLMDPLHIMAEQVGYLSLESTRPHLEMMGGEFCVNATRAAAAVLHKWGKLTSIAPNIACGSLSVSGAATPLCVFAGTSAITLDSLANSEGIENTPASPSHKDIHTAVLIELTAKTVSIHPIDEDAYLVRLPGISHALLGKPAPCDLEAPQITKKLRIKWQLETEDASGVVWYQKNDLGYAICPYVYVKNTASEFKETACGSASLALACLDAWRVAPDFLCSLPEALHPVSVRQLSGRNITISFLRGNTLPKLPETVKVNEGSLYALVGGTVDLVAEGLAYP